MQIPRKKEHGCFSNLKSRPHGYDNARDLLVAIKMTILLTMNQTGTAEIQKSQQAVLSWKLIRPSILDTMLAKQPTSQMPCQVWASSSTVVTLQATFSASTKSRSNSTMSSE